MGMQIAPGQLPDIIIISLDLCTNGQTAEFVCITKIPPIEYIGFLNSILDW